MSSRDSIVQEELKLKESLQNIVGKNVVDVEMLANLLSEKDHNSLGRLHASHVSDCMKTIGIELDKTLLGRIIKFTEVKRGVCSISQLVDLVGSASAPINDEEAQKGSDVGSEDSQEGSGFESDGSWKQLLQYRGSQPTRQRTKNTTDASVKQKNIKRLRNAMMMSYRQHEGWFCHFFTVIRRRFI